MLFEPSGIVSHRPLSLDLPALWLCHFPHSLQKLVRSSALAKLRISCEGCGALSSLTTAFDFDFAFRICRLAAVAAGGRDRALPFAGLWVMPCFALVVRGVVSPLVRHGS